MQNTFRTLASIAAWVLFLFGLAALAMGMVRVLFTAPALALVSAYFTLGVVSLFLSVVVMRLRKDVS